MSIEKDQDDLMSRIMSILLPMDGVSNKKNYDGTFSIIKNGAIFAKLKDTKIHLIDRNNDFRVYEKEVIYDRDNFLKKATNAYWVASGKKW